MISRFFASRQLRRYLCFVLALLTLAFALSPALSQPAEAVAVADDITLALGLLFTSWAGITFATNAGAQTAVSNLISSKPAVASSLAGLITKNLVTEGSKLLLTGDVKTAFRSVLPEIKDFFGVTEDNTGSLPVASDFSALSSGFTYGVWSFNVVNATAPVYFRLFEWGATDGHWNSDDDWHLLYPIFFSSGSFTVDVYKSGQQISDNYRRLSNGLRRFLLSSSCTSYKDCGGIKIPYSASPESFIDDYLSSLTFSDLTFKQSKEIDGTQVEEITWGIQFVPDPSDPTQPTDDGSGNPQIPVWPLGPQKDIISNASTDLADQDPGLSPEKMIEELRKLLQQQQPNPDPDPEPDPDPDPDPSDPDTPGGGDGTPPDFNGMMLPGLKDFFPFCIPFDLYNMMQALCAEPEAPKFQFATSFLGQVYTVDIDLSAWDNVAATIRYMVVAIYIVALAVATRKFIKW